MLQMLHRVAELEQEPELARGVLARLLLLPESAQILVDIAAHEVPRKPVPHGKCGARTKLPR